MSTPSLDSLTIADRLCREIIAPAADRVDREAAFPSAAIEALGREGLLGLITAAEHGGAGKDLRAAALVVERIARDCASTAMVLTMHYAGARVIEALGPPAVRREIAAGRHLSTLAFSEVGSRGQFWAPVGTARRDPGGVRLDGKKSMATAARHATAYVWSSKPLEASGASTLWLVPRATPGISQGPGYDGLGLRGNDSTPIRAEGAVVPETSRLGRDGDGLNAMVELVLPTFNVLAAGCSLGLAAAAVERTIAHVTTARFENNDSRVVDLPTVRAYVARMLIATDQARALWLDTLAALETARADAMLRVLECKAAAAEAACDVLDLALRVSGGAAYRKELALERRFRDARASTIMAPTTDMLYEFLGRAGCGLPVFA